jgi:hypothetical protein
MARANGNCTQSFPLRVFQLELNGWFKTVKATCWSAAVVFVFPAARPISWVEHEDHVLVNGEIKVQELRHVSLSCVR